MPAHDITRRNWLGLAAGAAGVAAAGPTAAAVSAGALDALAKAKRFIGFGSCIGGVAQATGSSFHDMGVRAIHEKECGIVVCEYETKWMALRPNPRDFDFTPADQVADWATAHGMKMRGHTLLWQDARKFPAWLLNYDFGTRPASEAERLLRAHVTTVCSHFGTRIFTWDVVNEAVDEVTGEMRETPFTRHLGPAAIEICFDAAARAAPNATLAYNDYMGWEPSSARHREGVLKLLSRLKSAGAKLDVLGVQSHIGPGNSADTQGANIFNAADQTAWKEFIDAVVGMGLRLGLTEFDVSELGAPTDIPARDAFMADLTRRYLGFMFAYTQVDYLMAWGMMDHYSWHQNSWPRPDGMLKRPSPYNSEYLPKPMRQAIADAFDAAPMRA